MPSAAISGRLRSVLIVQHWLGKRRRSPNLVQPAVPFSVEGVAEGGVAEARCGNKVRSWSRRQGDLLASGCIRALQNVMTPLVLWC